MTKARLMWDPMERFIDNIKVSNSDCWIWTASAGGGGSHGQYGYFMFDRHNYTAHRFSYFIYVGELLEGLQIDHLCKNTLCVNPEHLEQVTQQQNILRSNGVGGVNGRKTHCKHGHEFTHDNIYVPPKRPNRRYCRICHSVKVLS